MLHQVGAGTLGPVFRAYDAERERPVEAPARVTGVAMTRLADHPKRGKCAKPLLTAI